MSNRCEDFPCCGHHDEDGTFCPPNDDDLTYTGDLPGEVKFFLNEDGYPYPYPVEHQARDFPDDFHQPFDTFDEAHASLDDDYDYILDEQRAQLDSMNDYYGIEPRGWEDSY